MNDFEKYGYQILKNVIEKQTCKLLEFEFDKIVKNICLYNDPEYQPFDGQANNCFWKYSVHGFEALLLLIQPKVEEVVGKNLLPSYSYARIYYREAEMERHVDRRSCEYSVTACISIDKTPWEIWFKDKTGKQNPVSLSVGDICIYKGDEIEHWRTPYTEDKQIQAFLHYVDRDGAYSNYRFDGRPLLGLPYKPNAINTLNP